MIYFIDLSILWQVDTSPWGLLHCTITCFMIISRDVSKPESCVQIWSIVLIIGMLTSSTAALVCQISEQYYHFKTQFLVFGYYDKSSDRLLEQPLGPLNQVTRYFEAGRPVQWYRNTLVVEWYIATSFPSTETWGDWCQKQVSQTVISNFIPQYSVDWNYVSMPEIPASGTKVLAFSRRSKLIISILCYIESLVTIFMPSYGKEIH